MDNYFTRIDFVGKVFYEYGRNYRKYVYECVCGNKKYVKIHGKRTSKSCGCMRGKGGLSHGMSYSRFYRIWVGMDRRCNYPLDTRYSRYGGRGIKLLWTSFEEFYKDMYGAYKQHLLKYGKANTTIDRIDNNGNYCKENCRRATRYEQSNNNSQMRCITIGNQTNTIVGRAKIMGVRPNLISKRLSRGRDEEKSVITPIKNNMNTIIDYV